jgi:4-amino-4-deoxy-L-arabinose transferase-like glycosyltransferase
LKKTHTENSASARLALEQRYAEQRHDGIFTLALGGVSIAALVWYYAHQQILLYGDAVAHINIARRVLDNRSWLSSFFQLGTVWLPLPHILMLPFVGIKALWTSGIAGSIPSMVAYIVGALGIFRLVSARTARGPAYIAAGIYALNPNLLYMQSTAMNEPLYLAFFVWAIVCFDEWLRELQSDATAGPNTRTPERALEGCGIALAGGAATRYDGWFFGAIIGFLVLGAFVRWWRATPDPSRRRSMSKSLVEFLLLNALVPVFWLAYNHRVSGHAMDWANGPYSAKAIAERTTSRGAPPYPGKDHVVTAGLYFLNAAKLNVGPGHWGGLMLALALGGTAVGVWRFAQYSRWLLLWVPLLFYSLSIAYGSVPIFTPNWWPFSYYNVRYGLELLPVFAVFPVLFGWHVGERLSGARRRVLLWYALSLLVVGSYLSVYATVPITLKEAQVNSRTRNILENALSRFLVTLPPSTTLLMYQGEHVGALQQAGIPLRTVISEISHPDWEWALLDPAKHADIIIAFRGDPVWMAAQQHRGELTELFTITVPEQAKCAVYRANREGVGAPHSPEQ